MPQSSYAFFIDIAQVFRKRTSEIDLVSQIDDGCQKQTMFNLGIGRKCFSY